MESNMRAIILAAGKGRRLEPLTRVIPKPMLLFGNKPFLSYIIHGLARIPAISEIAIVIGHLGEQIRGYFKNQYLDTPVRYFEQTELLGTAHAVLQCEVQAPRWLSEDLIVMAGDSLFPQDFLQAMIHDHQISGAAITLALEKVPLNEISKGSSCQLKHEFRDAEADDKYPWTEILDVIEKPDPSEAPSVYNSACIYAFKENIPVFERIRSLKMSSRQEFEMPQVISSFAKEGNKVRGLLLPERISHVSNLYDYFKSNLRFLDRVKDSTQVEQKMGSSLTPPVLFDRNIQIAASTRIGPNVILGKGVKIEENVNLSNVLVLPDSTIKISAEQGIFYVNPSGETEFIGIKD